LLAERAIEVLTSYLEVYKSSGFDDDLTALAGSRHLSCRTSLSLTSMKSDGPPAVFFE
jgi:hypothetical protein